MKLELIEPLIPLDPEKTQKAIELIGRDPNGKSGIDALYSKIETVVNGCNDPSQEDQFTHQMKILIKDDVLGEISQFASELDPNIKPIIDKVLKYTIDEILTSNEDIFNAIKEKYPTSNPEEIVYNILQSKSTGTYDESLSKLIGDTIKFCAASLQYNDSQEYRTVIDVTTKFIENLLNNPSEDIFTELTPYIIDGLNINGRNMSADDIKTTFTNKLLSCVQDASKSEDAMKPINDLIMNGVNTIINRLNTNIQGIFCQQTEILSLLEPIIPVNQLINNIENDFKQAVQDKLNGNNNKPISPATNSSEQTPNNSKEKKDSIKNDVEKTNKEKAENAKNQENKSNPQPSSPEPTETKQSDSNKSSKTSNNVENRKESKENEKKDNKKEDPKEPDLQTYDNSKPSPAAIQNDPRRASQELVFWEGVGDHYVLLRNKIGSYIFLGENDDIRIQSKSGSFIELKNNGDIVIQPANKLQLAPGGTGYINKI